MKTFIATLIVAASAGFCQSTVYGPSGLNFTPSAFAGDGGRWSGSVGGTTDDSPLFLASIQGRFLDDRLEVSASNAWRMVEGDSVGWNPGTVVAPVIPSAKWILDREDRGRQSWGYSAGLSMPLGAWVAAGWRLRLPIASPEFDAGLGTPLNSIQAFGGMAVDLCDLEGTVLPVRLTADGALSGSTGALGRTEEAYWSVGVTTHLGRNLSFQVVHRRDRTYNSPAEGNRAEGVSLLRVLWNFGTTTEGASR